MDVFSVAASSYPEALRNHSRTAYYLPAIPSLKAPSAQHPICDLHELMSRTSCEARAHGTSYGVLVGEVTHIGDHRQARPRQCPRSQLGVHNPWAVFVRPGGPRYPRSA